MTRSGTASIDLIAERHGGPREASCVLLLVLALAFGCREAPDVSAAPPLRPATAVNVETVHPEVVTPRLRVPGLVEARARISLAFRVPGFIQRFHVEEGDGVETGDLLAELDRADLERDVRSARAVLQRAAVRARNAETIFERQRQLFETQSTSQQQYDEARSTWQIARAEQAEARVRLDAAEDRLAKAVLRAPVSGLIERRLHEAHERVTPDTTVLVLTDLSSVTVRAAAADSHLPALAIGNVARVRSPLWPQRTFTGHIVRIDVAADPETRAAPFEVEIANSDFSLRPELIVEVEVPTGKAEPLLLVPLASVLRDIDTRPFCFLVAGESGESRAERRPVEVGSVHGERIRIVAGLEPGERLITRGQHFLRDGDPVHILEE